MAIRDVTSYQRGLELTLAESEIIIGVSRLPEVKEKIYFGCHKSAIIVVINAFRNQLFIENRYIPYQDEAWINSEVTHGEYLFYDGLNTKSDENMLSVSL